MDVGTSQRQKRKYQLNEVYFPYLFNEDRYLILYGGAGSGKSHFVSQKLVGRCINEKGHRFLCVRKIARTLRASVFQQLYDVLQELEWLPYFEINKSEMRFTCKNGNEILLAGLDDVEKLKSITGVTGIWLEEATETESNDLDQLDLRLRGETNHYKQIILTFNPVNEKSYLKTRFFDKDHNNTSILKTTYKDNHFIDAQYKETLDNIASVNPNYGRIYKEGQWGKMEIKRPYAYNFEDRHIKECKIRDRIPVRLSFDFNIDPFVCLFLQIWRDKEGHHIHFIDEIILHNGNVYEMCDRIKGSLTNAHLGNMYVTGDAMQRKREITQKDNRDAWMILSKELKLNDNRLQVPRSNPRVRNNRFLLNSILKLHPDIRFNPKLTTTINEMEFTEADAEGNILKKDRNKLEQRADALDCVRYALNTWMPDFIDRMGGYK